MGTVTRVVPGGGGSGGAHASDHVLGGTDEINGDHLGIDFTPANYTPSTAPAEASNVDHLAAHFAGIDIALGAVSGAPFDDATAIIKGSADPSKLLRFEVDGLTTATTRVVTAPDADITLVNTSDGTISDTNVNASAAIATSKLADAANFALIDQANVFGDFDQTFKDNRLKIENPLGTFEYTFVAAAIGADYNITLPLLTGSDTMVTEAFAQTLTNKTVNLTSNTLSGTKAEFDTAVTDGNFMYIGDAPTAHTHLLAAGATDVSATAAELNVLDLSLTALTTGWVYAADGLSSASWRQLLGSEINNDQGWTANAGDMVLASTQTVTGAKTFNDGTLLLDDSDSAFDLVLQSTSTITTANKTLTFDVNDANRTLTLGGNATLNGGTHSGTNTGDETLSSINALAITTVGTVDTGTWEGTAIATGFIASTLTGKALTGVTTLSLDDTDSAFNLVVQSTSTITTADKTLTIDVNDANRLLTISGDATISGTNTGDQTDMSGISDTKANFDTAASDGNFTWDGDSITVLTGTAWRIWYSNGSGVITELALGGSGTYLQSNGVSSAPTWATPAGSGDMVLADVQTVTGAKTFNDGTLLLDDSDSAFDLVLQSTSTITTANKTLTFDVNDANRTLTLGGNATLNGGTHSGTNTGDQTDMSGISDTKANFDASASDGNFTWDGDSVTVLTGTNWRLFYSNGSGTITELALGTSGQYLKANGVSAAPTWDTPGGSGDVIGDTASADKELVRFNGAGGKTIESPSTDLATTTATLSDNADLTLYDAVNDGNPVFSYGSTSADRIRISPVYDTGAQTLDYALFATDSGSAVADKGQFRFDVDGATITYISDTGINLAAGMIYSINGTQIRSTDLSDGGDVVLTTKSNIFGDFDQIFADNRLQIQNPAGTFAYTIVAGAITGSYNATLPTIASNDVFVMAFASQTLSTKVIDSSCTVQAGSYDAGSIDNDDINASAAIATSKLADSANFSLINQANSWGAFNQNINTGGSWQEGGVAISPIGTHEQSVGVGAMDVVTATAVTTRTVGATTNRKVIRYMSFTSTTADEFGTFKWTPPANWNAGTIRVKFKWTFSSGSGDVIWSCAAVAIANDDAIASTAYGTAQTVTDTALVADDEHETAFTSAITVGNTPTAGDSVWFRIQRDGATAGDNFSGTAELTEVIVEITTDAATTT